MIQKDVALKKLNTFQIGGFAKFYVQVKNTEDLKKAFHFAKQQGISYFILGNGSNILFDDRGFNGLIIHNKIDFYENDIFGSGVSMTKLCTITGCFGFLKMVPASIGGAVFMNAGAFGYNISDFIKKIFFITDKGEEKTFYKKDLIFDYRYSSFKNLKGAITAVCLERGGDGSFLDKRMKTQPLNEKSAGCIFKNPKDLYAARLIQQIGLKGKVIGGAKVSKKHANFIVNEKKASSEDVLNLISFIKREVYLKYKVNLQEEICYLPYES